MIDLNNVFATGDAAIELQKLAFKNGIGWSRNVGNCEIHNYNQVLIKNYGSGLELATSDRDLSLEFKRLTMKDLKPRAKVEYELIKFKFSWKAVRAFEDGEALYTDENYMDKPDEPSYVEVPNAIACHRCHNAQNLYRKVETEITWSELVGDILRESNLLSCNHTLGNMINNDGSKLDNHLESEFLKICHLIASMTDKPE